MKIPYIRWWIDDWIGGTSWMSRTERGAYHDLLMHQSANGPMSNTMVRRILGADYNDVWPVIQCKFTEKNNLFFNEKMLSECQRVEEYSKSRSSNRRKNKGLHKKDMKNICKTYEKHMGSGSGSSSGSGYGVSGSSSTDTTSTSASTSKKRKQKPFAPPSKEEFQRYCTENGFGHIAKRAYLGYSEANWHDSEGKPVKNWKSKLQHVWFRDANRTPKKHQQPYY